MIATGKSMSYTGSGVTTAAVTLDVTETTDTTSSQTVSLGGTGAHIITLGSGTDSYTYTYSGTGTHGIQTVTATAGTNTITTLDAADIITMGTGADTISSGAGIDTISVATGNLVSTDTINAGAGVDILSMTNASTVVDADFTNITNLETFKQTTSGHAMTLTLGAASMASGLVTVTSGTGDSTIVVGAGHTSALAVTLATGTDSIVGSASAAALTVSITETGLESGDTITGGTGSDILAITGDGDTLAAADMVGVTLVETIKSAGDTALTIETHANNVAASGALTMDGSTLTTGILTFDGTNEGATTPGAFTITTLGTGGHIITLGSGNDTYTGTGSGDTTITATAGTNTITTGSGADGITLGTGVDTVTGGAGIDTITTATANLVSTDTIAGGAGVDIIALSDASATATIVDADFTNVTAVETLTLHTGNDTATLGAASSAAGIVTVNPGTGTNTTTIGAGHTGDLTVALSTGTDTIAAASYTGALTVTAAENSITAADTITGGTGSDTLTITGGGAGLTAAELAAVTKVETFKAASDAAQTIVMSDNNVDAGGSLTYNAALMTTAILTFTGSAETDGSYTINTLGTGAHIIVLGNGSDTYTSTNTAGVNTVTATAGNNTITTAAGADIITLGSGSDTVSTGAAADVIVSATANLNLNDTVNGGAGTDVLQMSTDGSVVIDADFTNITNVETLTMNGADKQLTATLGALAAAAGIVTVTDTDTGGAFSLTLAAGFTNNMSVTTATDAAVKTVDATNYTKVLTINASDAALDGSANVFTGGTGTSDELKVTATGQTITTGIASMTAIEKITTVGAAGALTMVLADGNVASGKTLTIDATSLDGDTLTVDASAETNGTITVNVSNAVAGAHVITLGAGADTHSGALGTGVQTVTATGGNNTITTGTAVDIINVGTGQDTITVNAGTANTINFTLSTHLVANSATVTDWTATKGIITLDVADLNAGATLQNLGSADDAVAGDTGIEIITGQTDLSAADDSDIILIADLTTAISSSDALETALEYGGALQLTMARALAVGDRFLVAYDDNVSSYVAMVTMNTTAPDNGYFGAGSLTAVTLVKLTGVTEASVAIAVGDVDLE
jgi:hypothetical protein